MVVGGDSSSDEMAQDVGKTELDEKRKKAFAYTAAPSNPDTEAEWDYVAPPFVGSEARHWLGPETAQQAKKKPEKELEEQKQMIVTVPAKKVREVKVLSVAQITPLDLEKKTVKELQEICDDWGIQT